MNWIGLSALAHVLVVVTSGGTTPASTSFVPHLRADIRYVTAESANPIAPLTSETINEWQVAAEKPLPPDPAPEPLAQDAATEKQTAIRTSPQSVFELPLPFDAYYGPSDVDIRAQPINDILLIYPWVEYRLRVSGVVQLMLLINEHGNLDRVTVLSAKPSGVFEEAALEAVHKLQFSPALIKGRPVKSRKTIDVVFDPDEKADAIGLQPNSSATGK